MSKPRSKTEPLLSPREGARRLRLLLSWRERLALQSRRQPAAERRAAREEKALRLQIRQAIEETGIRLQEALTEPRQPDTTIERLRHDISQYNMLLKATDSSALGGFADLPLDDYARELGLRADGVAGRLERDDFITIISSLIIMVVLCLGIAWYHLWRADLNAYIDRPSPRQISIRLQNNSSFSVNLIGPWPEGGFKYGRGDYGLALYCRAVGSDKFQDCTNLREAWTYQRRAFSPSKPVPIEPGTSATAVLDLTQLERAYGSEVAEVRIDCGSTWRHRLFTFTEKLRQD